MSAHTHSQLETLLAHAREILDRMPPASDDPLATLASNPIVFPGERDADKGKVRMDLDLVFDTVEDAKEFLRINHLPTVIFDHK